MFTFTCLFAKTRSCVPLCALTLFVLAVPLCAVAPTYYVLPSGSDSNAGTLAAPFLTIQYAVNYTVSGDTVTLEDGTYSVGSPGIDFVGKNVAVIQ